MAWVIVGLGNPGEEYDATRHNTGRMALEQVMKAGEFDEWKADKKANAMIARGSLAGEQAILVAPDTFMNKSGSAVMKFVKSVKAAEKLIVIYDDLDLPIGTMKLSFDRGSGGHHGIESVTRAVKTKKFLRIRIGVSKQTAKGVAKKPSGEEAVVKFILAKFSPAERDELKKIFKAAAEAVATTIESGREIAMNRFN